MEEKDNTRGKKGTLSPKLTGYDGEQEEVIGEGYEAVVTETSKHTVTPDHILFSIQLLPVLVEIQYRVHSETCVN